MTHLEHIFECINKENPAVTILTGDFNAKSPLFWEHDTETREGRIFNHFLYIFYIFFIYKSEYYRYCRYLKGYQGNCDYFYAPKAG